MFQKLMIIPFSSIYHPMETAGGLHTMMKDQIATIKMKDTHIIMMVVHLSQVGTISF